ncbi:MAG: phenylalanine--tRNA ligase subunit beta [Chloracidobacterium sp.]|nr:phenylalanine--tRNA ligase subunit beta [Chloracidobacterium sp.]
MNISYKWLIDLIDIKPSADEVAEALTRVGLTVEGVHAHGEDFVLDIDLTSNRPDCLSHLGIARELSVIADRELRIADLPHVSNQANESNLISVEAPELCNRFTARIIKNVKVGPSPQWLTKRLEALGERSINNVADITNYVMLELGQPMHAFDLDKLAGNRIVVRRASKGEQIMTLKDVECELDETILAICDAEKPVAIAGIVGGLDSSITDDTVNVLLEVAYFKRENIRATSRKLNLATEASYRFERGVDIENLIRASNRATELICELASGEAGEFIDIYPTIFTATRIESKDISAAVDRLTGLQVAKEECNRILQKLGIKSTEPSIYLSPSWRHDIAIEEDLVEEVARHAGYENIANELPPAFHAGEYQLTESRKRLIRQTLADIGFDEAISYSFIDTGFDYKFETVPGLLDEKVSEQFVTLQDSVIEGALRMRPSSLPGLLEAVRHNINHQRRDVKLFEIGKCFAAPSQKDGLPNEQELLSLVVTGGDMNQYRAMPAKELDFYDAKGAVEAALNAAGFEDAEFVPAEVNHLRTGQSASILLGGRSIGYFGRLNDELSDTYKFKKQPVYVAEINLHILFGIDLAPLLYQPLSRFPVVTRDVSFIAPKIVTFNDIRATVNEGNFVLCRNIQFVDDFDKGMAENERSITVRFEYGSDERTLVEEEVEAVHQQILANIEQKLAIKPRF